MIFKGSYRDTYGTSDVLVNTGDEFWINLPLYDNEVLHNPMGFSWGFCGRGPKQLSYAVLRFYFEHKEEDNPKEAITKAISIYHSFEEQVISKLDDEWEFDDEYIKLWLRGGVD